MEASVSKDNTITSVRYDTTKQGSIGVVLLHGSNTIREFFIKDTNENGRLSLDEVKTQIKGLPDKDYGLLDTDENHDEVSVEEFLAFAKNVSFITKDTSENKLSIKNGEVVDVPEVNGAETVAPKTEYDKCISRWATILSVDEDRLKKVLTEKVVGEFNAEKSASGKAEILNRILKELYGKDCKIEIGKKLMEVASADFNKMTTELYVTLNNYQEMHKGTLQDALQVYGSCKHFTVVDAGSNFGKSNINAFMQIGRKAKSKPNAKGEIARGELGRNAGLEEILINARSIVKDYNLGNLQKEQLSRGQEFLMQVWTKYAEIAENGKDYKINADQKDKDGKIIENISLQPEGKEKLGLVINALITDSLMPYFRMQSGADATEGDLNRMLGKKIDKVNNERKDDKKVISDYEQSVVNYILNGVFEPGAGVPETPQKLSDLVAVEGRTAR